MTRSLALLALLVSFNSGLGNFFLGKIVSAQTGSDPTHDRSPDEGLLTVDRIFHDNEFSAKSLDARWIETKDKEAAYTVLEPSEDIDQANDIVRYAAESGERSVMVSASELVPPGKSAPLSIDNYAFSNDLSRILIYTDSKKVWRQKTRGEYWLLDRGSRQLKQLGGDGPPSTMMFARFSPDGRKVAFVRERELFVQDLFDFSIRSLTPGVGPREINGTTDWVYEEEFGLRDAYHWSPDGSKIAFWNFNTSPVPLFTMINNTDSLYPQLQTFAYPKVGQRNSIVRIGVYDFQQSVTKWMELPPAPSAESGWGEYIPRIEWLEKTGELLIRQMNRLQNTENLYLYNFQSGVVQNVMTETDDAWVDVHDEIIWADDASSFLWPSDRDGWRHVFRQEVGGGEAELVTPGEFDVIKLLHAEESDNGGHIYFIASPDQPSDRYLYRASWDGKSVQRVTPTENAGTHSYKVSADGKWAIHEFSNATTPPTIELVSLPDHKLRRVLEDNDELKSKLEKLAMPVVDFCDVDIGDVTLKAWSIVPKDLDESKKYPLLVYVYGEPAGSTVTNRWGGSKFLWHLMMAQKGYVVMSFDNRGTKSPRGRAFRKAIYEKIGIVPPADQAAAVQEVQKRRPYLDQDRVGIWGWSGGGSSSLQAIFKHPKLYHTAVAIAPVPNQLYYDTIYQERYMGLPETNVEGFREGSAINFAKNLEGNLLLIHGTADDNVHFQGSEMLVNELVSRNKQFTFFSYPNRSHSINERKNTTRHLRTMMTNYLLNHLPPGPK